MFTSPASKANPLSRNPLFVTATAYSLGIFLHLVTGLDFRIILAPIVIVLLATFVSTTARTATVLMIFLFLGSLGAGADSNETSKNALSNLYDRGWIAAADPVEIEGTLTDHPQLTIDGLRIRLALKSIRYKRELIDTEGNVVVFVSTKSFASKRYCKNLDLTAGNGVRLGLRLKREESFRNPGTLNEIESLLWQEIAAKGSAKSCLLLDVTGRKRHFFYGLYKFREWVTRGILETHDEGTAGIVLASLVGNRNFLTKESAETFRKNGTFHVLVISGLHITLIGGLILLAVRRVTNRRITQLLTAGGLLWAYAFLVGLQLPVLRAVIMFSVYLVAQTLYRANTPLNSLGAAIFAILIWRPSDLLNPSFQLTCLSLLGIIGFAFPMLEKLRSVGAWFPETSRPLPPAVNRAVLLLAEALYWSNRRWEHSLARQNWSCRIVKTRLGNIMSDTMTQRSIRTVFELAFVSLSVQLFLLPLLVIRFHRLGAASPISNIFAGVAVAAQNIAAIVSLAIGMIDIEAARAFVSVSSSLTRISLYLQRGISEYLLPPRRIPVYTGRAAAVYWMYFLSLAQLTGMVCRWDPYLRWSIGWRRFAVCSSLILLLLIAGVLFHPFSSPRPNGRLRVDFLDVGQGDAALVTFPNGTTMLIDGGGQGSFGDDVVEETEPDRSRIGEKVVSEFLWEKGYSQVDFLVSTHPDADHINGLVDVLRNFRVRTVFVGGYYTEVREFKHLRDAAASERVPLNVLQAGDSFAIGEVKVRILHPADSGSALSSNDDSMVLSVSFGVHRFLFTGDVESLTETSLLELNRSLSSTVVKVPHHGSRTSSTIDFVNAVTPEYAVIPVGRRSPYGHPHKEIVERWASSGARILTTRDSGTITFSTDGSDLNVQEFARP